MPKSNGRVPSRATVARAIGTTERTIYGWEHTQSVPQERFIPLLATVFDRPEAEIRQAVAVQRASVTRKRVAAA